MSIPELAPLLVLLLALLRANAFGPVAPPPTSSKRPLQECKASIETTEWIESDFEQSVPPLKENLNPALQAFRGRRDEHKPTNKRVWIYDTTLRDGTQGEAVAVSCADKLRIAERLSTFGVDFIEAGWPGSNPKDAEFFQQAPTKLSAQAQAKLVAFGSTRRKYGAADQDAQLQALVDAGVPTVCMVAKGHAWQVTDILRCELEENIKMIQDSVQYLVSKGIVVLVDLEHFFDGYKHNATYALECGEAAVQAGASSLVLCDTNGGSMPWELQDICQEVVQHFRDTTIGIHTHNDCGMAVANSLQACHAGIQLVQGTMNGIGERTGNADLCTIIPSLAMHYHKTERSSDDKGDKDDDNDKDNNKLVSLSCRPQLSTLTQLSRWVDEVLNRSPNTAAPFVGSSAFAHKGGLHVAAMERSPWSYQHVDPADVGNEQRILISELSGRQNILSKFSNVLDIDRKNERALAILERVKQLEHEGYTFEGAEASVHLMMLHATKGYCPPFSVLDYSAQVYDQQLDSASRVLMDRSTSSGSSSTSRATVKVRAVVPCTENGSLQYQDSLQVSDGVGPVDALAQALLRALLPLHPHLANVELVDYKVRILDPTSATHAATRVLIAFKDTANETTWTTVSVDRNVISASLNALVDGLEYALIEHADQCMLCDDAFE